MPQTKVYAFPLCLKPRIHHVLGFLLGLLEHLSRRDQIPVVDTKAVIVRSDHSSGIEPVLRNRLTMKFRASIIQDGVLSQSLPTNSPRSKLIMKTRHFDVSVNIFKKFQSIGMVGTIQWLIVIRESPRLRSDDLDGRHFEFLWSSRRDDCT
jgi:hypothetical protein